MKPYYEKDGITIFHGDCREILPGLAFDVVLTDPPYGVEYRAPRDHTVIGDRRVWPRASVQGDRAWTFTRPSVPFVVWGANNDGSYSDCGWLVWDKERYGADLFGDGELAAISSLRGVHIRRQRWNRNHGEGWTGSHPTEKPISLMTWAMSFLPGGSVCDPFMGAGSTLLAARQSGRRAIGIEIEERYCEIAAKRLDQQLLPFETT